MLVNRSVVMVFLTAVSWGRISSAFFPASRSFVTKESSAVTAGFRRRRAPRSGESAQSLIENLQREKGLFRDFRHGHFVVSSDVTERNQIAELPSVFPLEGKIPEEEPPRMRFAPSPTGSLHVGGARTALYNWLVAKKGQMDYPGSNAAFVLRVEDTDVARSTKESEASVIADLKWLGLIWDEGPDMEGTNYGPYRQSERSDIYFAAAQRLLQDGKAYRCFCTPEELEEMKAEQESRGETPRYDGRWRDADPALVKKMMDEGRPYTVRFKVPSNSRIVIEDVIRGTVAWDAEATVGDFILLRSSGVPVYNFCVAVDDAAMGITTVVRAEEHLTNTVRQALALDALNAPRPRYAHCSLILGEDKQKLSKRHGATSCDQYRLDGFLPDAMINYLALLGWNDGTDNEIFTREELIDAFDLNRVVKSPSVFDIEKLKWVNGQHLKMMSVTDVCPYVQDQLQWAGFFKADANMESQSVSDFTFACTSLAKTMMDTTKDAAINAKTVLGYGLPPKFEDLADDSEAKEMIKRGNFYVIAQKLLSMQDEGLLVMPDPANLLSAFADEDAQKVDTANGHSCQYTADYMKQMKVLAKELGVKGKNLFHPARLALTGEMSGQDVTKQLSLLELAVQADDVIDLDSIGVVPFGERMERLRKFCESIPTEFQTPSGSASETTEEKKETKSDKAPTKTAPTETVASQDPLSTYDGPPITALDIRVGRITKVWEHPEAEKLYCEQIDVGEDEPRQIASGLRPYLKPEDMEGRKVLVLCNLKERKLVGFPSHGMVLCASNSDHTEVKLVNPPLDAKIGERIVVPDFDFESEEGQPYPENKIGKKKVFESIAPYLVTNKYGIPEFLGRPFMTSAGACTSPIGDGSVS
ncbi:glutamyl-tRNA synthetase [Fistulifera solaris]|uniref:glutamate--tRNA ligase n=1 Tax=Fistulifera solaris TaxID=1519565 RepID=A0A1Z5JGP4_FISSO|nr:glutamyl-tRNA synthetase [Fistulifera solaris]|eukprot:GAX13173.1 glutamyl-tRNA synthetase [Fistulifera solaris]